MLVKRFLTYRNKIRIRLFFQQFKQLKYFKNVQRDSGKKYAFLFLAADYGNLGDIAITYAQKKFIQDHSSYTVIEIPISKSLEGLRFVKGIVEKDDIVTIVGGGNLGDTYDKIEFLRQLVLKFFPHNKVISFPQTFDFKNKKYLRIAKKVYNKHEDLYLIAREATSYHLMQQHFRKAKILLIPDIVLSLERPGSFERKGALICIRNDKEKKISNDEVKQIVTFLEGKYESIDYCDTQIHKNGLSLEERANELDKILKAFSSSELVITDRLHGMIFCHITQTPCIVFPNNNHKIEGTYDWIKKNDKVHFTKAFEEESLRRILDSVKHGNTEKSASNIDFQPLINILN